MLQFANRLGLAIAAGLVFLAFSEIGFWGHYDYVTGFTSRFLPALIGYCLLAYAFLWIVSAFRARELPALFLAGALYGWLAEGIVVFTMYDSLPLSISFTGLAWHALLTVTVGFRLFSKRLAEGPIASLLKLCLATGVVWGLWCTWWWSLEPFRTSPAQFALYATQTTSLAAIGLAVFAAMPDRRFRPSWPEKIVVGGLFAVQFVFGAVPARPVAALVLPICAGLAVWGLAANRRQERLPDLIVDLAGRIAAPRLAALAIVPASASVVYAALWTSGGKPWTGPLLYLATVPTGFGLFGWALWKLLKRESRPTPPQTD
jgi:hypothetical protein